MAKLGSTTYTSVTWTAGDTITEAKLDNMVANDQAYDSHAAQGLLLNNDKALAGKDSGNTNRNLIYITTGDDIYLGDSGLSGDIVPQNTVDYGDSMPSTDVNCKVYRATSVQSVANETTTKVEFNAESWDVGNDFDSSTNYEFIAPTTGYYDVAAQVRLNFMNAGDAARIYVYVDGSEAYRRLFFVPAAGVQQVFGSWKVKASSGEAIDVRVWHNRGSATDVQYLESETWATFALSQT